MKTIIIYNFNIFFPQADGLVKQKNFCKTLEQYKEENDSIVEQHVKEYQALQLKLQEAQTASATATSDTQWVGSSFGQDWIEKQIWTIFELKGVEVRQKIRNQALGVSIVT